MSFPWWQSAVPAAARKRFAAHREAMYLRELEERAALLFRLGYPREHTARRLRGNLRWDFELCGTPALIDKVDAIVKATYRRGRAGGAGPPSAG